MNQKIKLFVIGSVLLNILLAGVILGHLSHRLGMPPRPPFAEPPELSQLPKDKQLMFRAAMEGAREKAEDTRRKTRALKKEMEAILSAEPFDKAAYEAKVKKVIALHEQRKQYFADAVAGLAQKFTQSERKVLAKIVRRPPPPPHPPRGMEGHPPPPPPEE